MLMHFCVQKTIFCTICLLGHSMGKCQGVCKLWGTTVIVILYFQQTSWLFPAQSNFLKMIIKIMAKRMNYEKIIPLEQKKINPSRRGHRNSPHVSSPWWLVSLFQCDTFPLSQQTRDPVNQKSTCQAARWIGVALRPKHSMGHESSHWKSWDFRKRFRRIEFNQKVLETP